jgi:alpha,alpha-trehalase
MKKYFPLLLLLSGFSYSQVTPTPDVLWGDLFKEVQMKRVMGDNKTFVDMVPQFSPTVILNKYKKLAVKDSSSLRQFVIANFYLPSTPTPNITPGLSLIDHLNELWKVLYRNSDTAKKWSSLLALPHPYIVPGGRFREIYYWDSYFTMQGLAASNRYDLIESMVSNFAYLIDHYGHIPNGNRNYYLGRSQPPYFAFMVDLLQQHNGTSVYRKYLPVMEKEYRFWMEGVNKLKYSTAYRRVVKMPDGSILNRHWDDVNLPRQESYMQDVNTARDYRNNDKLVYRNLRASAESGWDFCSRWFNDTLHLNTIETTDIVPVDLNAQLYGYEMILSKAARSLGQVTKAESYQLKAAERKIAIMKYFWNDRLNYYFDYDLKEEKTTDKWSIAAAMPLFTNLATAKQAAGVKQNIQDKFLKDGGVTTTLYHTGEQWDAPNGWPPLQFLAVKGLLNYNYTGLARTIAERWMSLNEKVFASTGKMLEKYNVENTHLESGGGEYPTQDGFGWTNGVYLKFHQLFKSGNKY